MEFFKNVAVGTVTGIVTGLGIGGGTLLILYLTLFGGVSQLSAQGINLLYFLPTAGSALVAHIKNKLVVWRAVIFAGITGVLATIAAAIFAARVDMGILRRIFGGFLLFVGVSELFRKGSAKKDNEQ